MVAKVEGSILLLEWLKWTTVVESLHIGSFLTDDCSWRLSGWVLSARMKGWNSIKVSQISSFVEGWCIHFHIDGLTRSSWFRFISFWKTCLPEHFQLGQAEQDPSKNIRTKAKLCRKLATIHCLSAEWPWKSDVLLLEMGNWEIYSAKMYIYKYLPQLVEVQLWSKVSVLSPERS